MLINWRERFMKKVAVPADVEQCWEWIGSKSSAGYGLFHAVENGETLRLAHRAGYVFGGGVLEKGLCLDYLCRNRGCVNPLHLRQVTLSENIKASPIIGPLARERQAAKKICPYGHPYSGANLMISPDGARRCRKCARMHDLKRKERHRRQVRISARRTVSSNISG